MPTRYIVHGTDKNNQSVQKVFEAETSQEAERIAGRLGITVVGVEVDPASIGTAPPVAPAPAYDAREGRDFPDDSRASRRLGPESDLWKGATSQWVNFWWFVLCLAFIPLAWAVWKYAGQSWYSLLVLVPPLFWVLWRWLVIKTARYTLTSQRLRLEEGVLTKSIDEVELYRVKDTQLHQTIVDRALNIGTIEVLSSDETNPKLFLAKIPRPLEVREQLRNCVEKLRLARGVREVDLSVDNDPHGHL